MSKAVIFDFDGVVAETEPLQLEAYNRLLTQFGAPPLMEVTFIRDYIGLPSPEIIKHLKNSFDLSASIEELVSLKESLYEKIVLDVSLEPRPGLIELLKQLKSHGWKMAIASSSPSTTLRKLLQELNVDKYFWPILSSDSVEKGKPAPDIYELAASRLGVDKNRIVVIEDSRTGLEAAKQADLKCVVVPSRFTREHDFSACDWLAVQLADVTHLRLMPLIQSEIVYVPKSESGYCQVLFSAIRTACSTKRAEVILSSPQKDEDIHAQLVELDKLARRPPDALILVPIDDTPDIRRVLSAIERKGTTIVSVDQDVNMEAEIGSGSPFKSFSVAADCQKGGELAAQTLMDAIGYKGTVAMVSGPPDPKPSKGRRLGFLGYVASYSPEIRLETVRFTNWYKEEGTHIAADFIKQGINLDGIFCGCDNLAMAIANVYQRARQDAKDDLKVPVIVGFDGIPEIYEYILDGRILATVDVNVGYQGRMAFSAAVGEINRSMILIEPKILTKTGIKRERSRTRCFISYSHDDSTTAQELSQKLSAAGFHTFIDTQRIPVGDRFVKRCREEISKSHIFLAILSEGAVRSQYVRDELEFAVDREARRTIRILPIRLKGDYEIPTVIQDHSYIDFFGEKELVSDAKLLELVRAIDIEQKLAG